MQNKHNRSRMELKRRACVPRSERNVLQRPAIPHPVCHHCVFHENGGRNWRALEVFALARCVLGECSDGDIEACETRETAEDEEGEENVVEWCTQAQCKGSASGRDTERDLRVTR